VPKTDCTLSPCNWIPDQEEASHKYIRLMIQKLLRINDVASVALENMG